MSDEVIEGSSIQPPQPTGNEAVLAAYREATGWRDEDALHYADCHLCDPLAGDLEYYCRDSPRRQREQKKPTRTYGEPVRPQAPLPAALRRVGEQINQDAKRRPLNHRH